MKETGISGTRSGRTASEDRGELGAAGSERGKKERGGLAPTGGVEA
jgi:hypothetical protein